MEALIIGAVFLAIIGIFANVLGETVNDAELAGEFAVGKAHAEECALLLDSLYANKGGVLTEPAVECKFVSRGLIGVLIKEEVAEAGVVNPSTSSGIFGLEIKPQRHYGE